MARVTIEDCLSQIPNRFDLVHVAAKRTRELLAGGTPKIERPENDCPAVVSLREIEAGRVNKSSLDSFDGDEVDYDEKFRTLAKEAENVNLNHDFDSDEEEGEEGEETSGQPVMTDTEEQVGKSSLPEPEQEGHEERPVSDEGREVVGGTLATEDQVSAGDEASAQRPEESSATVTESSERTTPAK